MPKPTYPTHIRRIRQDRRLTLKDLATALKTTPQTVQRLETGGMTISAEWLYRIAKVLDVPVTDLLVPPTSARPEDAIIDMLRNALFHVRRDLPEQRVFAVMKAQGDFAETLMTAQDGVRPWSDVAKAAVTAAAAMIRIAMDGNPAQTAAPPLTLVSNRGDVA